MFGQVYVKNNKYKPKGNFHHLTPNTPIRNADDNWKLMGITNPRDMTYMHAYGGEAPFFESLSQGKLLGTRCDNPDCEYKGTIYQPFRIHCMDCLGRNTIIDMTDTAKKNAVVHTFMVCERSGAFSLLDKPIKFINVEFENVETILMSYLSIGDPQIGMRVVPIFKKRSPTYTILDLSWVPAGTKEEELPEGFSF
ncbi:Zn-ribbon domain-containing OB-fold protein [Planctomycetota bacterium]